MPIAAILKVRMAASTYRGAYRARMSRFIGKIWDEAVAARGVHPRWALSPVGATASYLRQLVEVVSTPPSTTRSSGVAASP